MNNFISRVSTVYFLLSILFVINCGMGANPPKVKTNPCVDDPTSQECFTHCFTIDTPPPQICGENCITNPKSNVCRMYCQSAGDAPDKIANFDTICATATKNICEDDPNSHDCIMSVGFGAQSNAVCVNNPSSFGCQTYCSGLTTVDPNCDKFCTGTDKFNLTCSNYCRSQKGSNPVCEAFCNGPDASNSISVSNCVGYCGNQKATNHVCETNCTANQNSFACMRYRKSLSPAK